MAADSIKVSAEIDDDGSHVIVKFPYHPDLIARLKGDEDMGYPGVPSRKFIPREKGGPHWQVNLELPVMRRLREAFGDHLKLGSQLRRWGKAETKKESNLQGLSQADDAKLEIVPNDLTWISPEGDKKTLRAYQRADIAFMAASNSINANQPGAGKTVEWILALVEAGLAEGAHLVMAPLTSLRLVWEEEIVCIFKALIKAKVVKKMPIVLTGDDPDERRAAIDQAYELASQDPGPPFFLVLNPAMGRMEEIRTYKGKRIAKKKFEQMSNDKQNQTELERVLVEPDLAEIIWDSFGIDEFHLMGLSNPTTLTAQGVNLIRKEANPEKLAAISGTPMGGKPIKLWGALHFLDPVEFTSRMHWARTWLKVSLETVRERDDKKAYLVEGIAPGRDVDFYDHLKSRLVRRTKMEVLPGLPPKVPINIKCPMTPAQADQYMKFASEAEWRLEDKEMEGRLSATNILAEYMRLKQFAGAYCDVRWGSSMNGDGLPNIDVIPTADSGKLEMLWEKLREENVLVGKSKDEDAARCAIIFSQFVPFVHLVATELEKLGVPVGLIFGGTKSRERVALARAFQTQKPTRMEKRGAEIMIQPPRVLVLNTLAGGASIQLSRADSIHMLDETWVPDNQEQAEDRGHRGDALTMAKDEVRVYYYRTVDSIEQYVQQVNIGKALNNHTILDLRRRMQQEAGERETVAA